MRKSLVKDRDHYTHQNMNFNSLIFISEQAKANIHPLAFTEYDEEAILREIQSIGWVNPADTDPNSTKSLLNALATIFLGNGYCFTLMHGRS